MIIIHHNDLDGRMAAAFTYQHMCKYFISFAMREHHPDDENFKLRIPKNVRNKLGETFKTDERSMYPDFYEYYYNNKFTDALAGIKENFTPEYIKDETVFIVDCSITEKSAAEIMELLDTVKQVVLIDHHQSSLDYKIYCELNTDGSVFENSIFNRENFYHCITNINSGALLCDALLRPRLYNKDFVFNTVIPEIEYIHDYQYEYFMYDDANDLNNISNFTRVTEPAHRAALLTDDYDRWIHKFEESKYLNSGARMEPANIEETYLSLIDDPNYLNEVIATGKTIIDYTNNEAKINRSRCHEEEICGIKTLCLNAKGNSSCFVDEDFNKYNMVCLYYFHGKSRVWTYSFYSKLKENGVCHKIAAKFGGGGHPGAAGCSIPFYLFDDEHKHLLEEPVVK